MIYMLLQLMGEDKLKIGLQDYLEEFKFRTAESKDLWLKLEKVRKFDHEIIERRLSSALQSI